VPTYQFECERDQSHPIIEEFFSMAEAPRVLPCANKGCKGPAIRLIGAGAGVIFKGGAPGQDIKRENEDTKAFNKARIARRLKRSGKVPQDAVLKLEDIDEAKYHGPKELPAGHPEHFLSASGKIKEEASGEDG
jgi:hypothetical protein